MKYTDNFCVNCETCICCGFHKDVTIYECDICEKHSTEEDFLTEYNGKELCPECAKKFENEISAEEIPQYYNEKDIYVEFKNGMTLMLQENDYTMEDYLKFAAEGAIFYLDVA